MNDRGLRRDCAYVRKRTNADRIRVMTDEELADFLTGEDMCELLCSSPAVCPGHCKTKCLEWLRQEAEA